MPQGFVVRPCPSCGLVQPRTLARVSAATIVRSNWSYRPDGLASLDVAGHEAFPIEQCQRCGFVYAGLLPPPGFLAKVYDELIDIEAVREDNRSPANLAWKMRYVSTLLRLLPGPDAASPRILDFGCGFGGTLDILGAVRSVTAWGFDTSATRLAELAARGLRATARLEELRQAAPYDAVILDNVLEHLPDPRSTLADIEALLRPGSIVFVSVPDTTADAITKIAEGPDTRAPMDINPWEHLNYFDLAHLDGLLSGFGLAPLKSAQLEEHVDVGLRPALGMGHRVKNSLASLVRMASYAAVGDAMASVTRRYYRNNGRASAASA